MTHTVLSVLRAAEGWLAQHQVEAPRRSAELLLARVLSLPRLQLYLQHDRPMTEPERASMRALVARRGKHEPVAHLLGEWSFRGHDLFVTKDVLVPRPETEELVDLALSRAPIGARVLDLGTGSGAIAIALAKERPDLSVVAVDVSEAALLVAARNVERHGLSARVQLRLGSWWEPVRQDGLFDLLVSNPPYVDPAREDLLAADVARYEPAGALFSERGDPGSCYRRIGAGIAAGLRPGASLVLETGVGASEASLREIANAPAIEGAALLRDLSGHERFVVARRSATASAGVAQSAS